VIELIVTGAEFVWIGRVMFLYFFYVAYLSHDLVLMIFVLILFELFATQCAYGRMNGQGPLELSGCGHRLFAIFCVVYPSQISGCGFRGGRMKEL
jgi:hypothetical protein